MMPPQFNVCTFDMCVLRFISKHTLHNTGGGTQAWYVPRALLYFKLERADSRRWVVQTYAHMYNTHLDA